MNSNIVLTEMQLSLDAIAYRVAEKFGSTAEWPKVPEKIDESSLLRFGRWHNLFPWLSIYIERFELGSNDFRDKISKLSCLDRAVYKVQAIEATRISRVLDEHLIKHVFFKGVTVTEKFYSGLVSSRYSDDIDILIKPDDLPVVYQILSDLGYQGVTRIENDKQKLTRFVEQHSSLYRWRDISLKKRQLPKQNIDLHWKIADKFTLDVDTAWLIEQRQLLHVGGHKLPSLPFSLLFVYVCVHGHTDFFFRLRYLVDVYAAMKQIEFNYDDVLKISADLGVKQKVVDAISTAKLFFEGEQNGNQFAEFVLKRFVESNGYPDRGHPNHREWTRRDRKLYLRKQIKHRSSNSAWYEPLLARCKYDEAMVESWPEHVNPLAWYPIALVTRLLK